jgi:hypothetical protein
MTHPGLPIRPVQPQPQPQLVPQIQLEPILAQYTFPQSAFQGPQQGNRYDANPQDRMSVSTINTWSSGSAQSAYNFLEDDTFSNPRSSIATTNSSVSAVSSFTKMARPVKPPKHDPEAGLWNDLLRVIPCDKDHSGQLWYDSFTTCLVCGFSRWHSLMLYARSIEISTFVTSMNNLRDISRVDFAGNYPIHFLMASGVGMEYFTNLLQWADSSSQNVFGQNPLHVLNPQDLLGEQLISFLEWFKGQEHPPGLLLTQRDINCRTPLHALLHHPLERHLYHKILKVFPFAEHQLRSLDNKGRSAIKMMDKASMKIKAESTIDYEKIQAGITEVRLYLSGAEENRNGNTQRYGFHDIARGARGFSYQGFYYQCRICNQINAHSNSYLDQMKCACAPDSGRDRTAPDETGMTPAHALVTQARCNNDDAQTPESPAQTTELFKVLIPPDDPTFREALHVLDGEGKSLVYNIATRGFDELLEYVLQLEQPSRRLPMVNACAKGPNGTEWSVLAAVRAELKEISKELRVTDITKNAPLRRILADKRQRLTRVLRILVGAGAELRPKITTRWRISG